MTTTHDPASADDNDIANLLRETGGRETPSSQVMAEVEAAVFAEWRDTLEKRKLQRRRVVGWSIAASVAIAGLASIFAVQLTTSSAPVRVATIARIDGQLIASSTDSSTPSVKVGQGVVSGESLRTDGNSRVALNWPSGMSVRLDRDTAIRIAAGDRIEIVTGAVYVDAGPGRSEPLSIESALGTVRHVGTQYEVRKQPQSLLVSVREGRVSIHRDTGTMLGAAGEQLRLAASGSIERTRLSASDALWDWATTAAPSFQIDHQSLSSFLNWMSRETGRHLVFASPQAQEAATRVILRGSIDGLDLDTALTAVLSTTQLRQYETKDDSIGIALNSD